MLCLRRQQPSSAMLLSMVQERELGCLACLASDVIMHGPHGSDKCKCRGPKARRVPLDGLEIQDHVSDVEADHAEDAAACAGDRQAVILERRAENVACAGAVGTLGPSGNLSA